MTYYNQSFDAPELTFISKPEVLSEELKVSDLSNPYLLLKYRPSCECGKDFRSSGKDKAEQQIVKHISYKKYADCKPVVEELDYSGLIPSVNTVDQIAGSDANWTRNQKLKDKIAVAKSHNDLKLDSELREIYGVHIMDDGRMWKMNIGSEFIPSKAPTVLDGFQIKQGINLKVTVIEKSKPRYVTSKSGSELTVCEAKVSDATGSITLTLWNEQVSTMNVGDKLIIKNAYAKEGQYYAGRGIGYATRIELGLYKNATVVEVIKASPIVA